MDIVSILKDVSSDIVSVKPLHFAELNENKTYDDARSAAFYAMGRAVKTQKNIVLLVPGMFLTNTYTAVTEGWFQKACVEIVAFYEKISDVKTAWMDRCLVDALTVGVDEENEIKLFLEGNADKKGPSLLNIVGVPVTPDKKDYSYALGKIQNQTVLTFNGTENSTIPYKYKYGVISEYIGSSIVKNKGILFCTSDCVMVDVNVFRTRYANNNMKIAVFDDGSVIKNKVDLWIKSNGWECKVTESLDDLEWLCNISKQAVLVVKEK